MLHLFRSVPLSLFASLGGFLQIPLSNLHPLLLCLRQIFSAASSFLPGAKNVLSLLTWEESLLLLVADRQVWGEDAETCSTAAAFHHFPSQTMSLGLVLHVL